MRGDYIIVYEKTISFKHFQTLANIWRKNWFKIHTYYYLIDVIIWFLFDTIGCPHFLVLLSKYYPIDCILGKCLFDSIFI